LFITRISSAPVRKRDGLKSATLLQAEDAAGSDLAVTWVDVEPGAAQAVHRHGSQQVYVIVRGQGRMRVGEEQSDVGAGDLVFIPSDAPHGVTNSGAEALTYVSAATPTFSITDLYDSGPLAPAN